MSKYQEVYDKVTAVMKEQGLSASAAARSLGFKPSEYSAAKYHLKHYGKKQPKKTKLPSGLSKTQEVHDKVTAAMKEKGVSAAEAALSLGISPKVFYSANQRIKRKEKKLARLTRKYTKKQGPEMITLTPAPESQGKVFAFYGEVAQVVNILKQL